MNVWSQIARLGAAFAALGPPILAKAADDEPDQVDVPTLGITDQPVAEAAITAPALDPDRNLLEDMVAPQSYTAAMPAAMALPNPTETPPEPPRDRPRDSAKSRNAARPHTRSWHGSGQRYG